MKVTSDGCLQGALAAAFLKKRQVHSVLDIGSGTGLLSLMVAQGNEWPVQHAVEINTEAYRQSLQNIRTADFPHQIQVFNEDVRSFSPGRQYDFILCNPPFFERDLHSPNAGKKQAAHGTDLLPEELLEKIDLLLTPEGVVCLMFPYRYKERWLAQCKKKRLFPLKNFNLIDRENKTPFRIVSFLQRVEGVSKTIDLILKEEDGTYSEPVQKILSPYYLHL